MSFEKYAAYRNRRRAEIGEPEETATALKRSYQGYLAAVELAKDDVEIVFEPRPNAPSKVLFVPKSIGRRASLG
jgi:hypothetical protein